MYQRIFFIGLAFIAAGLTDAQRTTTTPKSPYKVKDVKLDESYVNITTRISRPDSEQNPSLASVKESIAMDIMMRRMNESFRAWRLFPPLYTAFEYPSNSSGFKGLTWNQAYSLGFSLENPPSNATYVSTTTPAPENATTTEDPTTTTTNMPLGAQQFPNSQRNMSEQQLGNNEENSQQGEQQGGEQSDNGGDKQSRQQEANGSNEQEGANGSNQQGSNRNQQVDRNQQGSSRRQGFNRQYSNQQGFNGNQQSFSGRQGFNRQDSTGRQQGNIKQQFFNGNQQASNGNRNQNFYGNQQGNINQQNINVNQGANRHQAFNSNQQGSRNQQGSNGNQNRNQQGFKGGFNGNQPKNINQQGSSGRQQGSNGIQQGNRNQQKYNPNGNHQGINGNQQGYTSRQGFGSQLASKGIQQGFSGNQRVNGNQSTNQRLNINHGLGNQQGNRKEQGVNVKSQGSKAYQQSNNGNNGVLKSNQAFPGHRHQKTTFNNGQSLSKGKGNPILDNQRKSVASIILKKPVPSVTQTPGIFQSSIVTSVKPYNPSLYSAPQEIYTTTGRPDSKYHTGNYQIPASHPLGKTIQVTTTKSPVSHTYYEHPSASKYSHQRKLQSFPESSYKDESGYHYGSGRGISFLEG